jgi:hypothetical protein
MSKIITAIEVRGWFDQSIAAKAPRRVPSEEDVSLLVALLERDRIFLANLAAAEKTLPDLESWLPPVSSVLVAGHELREAFKKFDFLGDGFWQTFGGDPDAIRRLRDALNELGTFFQPRRQPKIGRPARKAQWQPYTPRYAAAAAEALRVAGHLNPSIDSKEGPVAKIGSMAIRRIFGAHIGAQTFAVAVRAARKIEENLRMGRYEKLSS